MRTFTAIPMILLFMSLNASATTVNLSADRINLTVGETIVLHLEVNPSEPVGGQFVLYREVEPKKYHLNYIFFDKPSCPSCAGEEPLSRQVASDFHYVAREAGNFWAEANFGGARDSVYFTVYGKATTTSTTTSTTLAASTTTSTTLAASTTTSTTTTLLKAARKEDHQTQDTLFRVLGILLFLVVFLAVVFLYFWKTR